MSYLTANRAARSSVLSSSVRSQLFGPTIFDLGVATHQA
jgi:hypothetical protein